MFEIFQFFTIPLDEWVNTFVRDWLVPNFRPAFRTMSWPVAQVLDGFQWLFDFIPALVFLPIAFLAAWRIAGRGIAIFTLLGLMFIGFLGLWSETMTTLAMVITAVAFCAIVGIPLGIAAARSDIVAVVIRPVLDFMQTIPAFVYLVPIIILFSVGTVPGVIATVIFALPPVIRLTNLGIRQVPRETVEAAQSFGSTGRQVLLEVQLPLATRTIMAGLNQTLLLALSMVVIAAMIGAGGLGMTVRQGLERVDVGLAGIGGIGLVLLAIILDRITQAAIRARQV